MRKLIPQHKEKRIVRRFALFPRFTDTEWRWLEWVTIEQEYSSIWDDCSSAGWYNVRFIDEK
jgi:hypothetical protein